MPPSRSRARTYSHAIPAMQEEAAALIAGLVLAEKQVPRG